MSRQKFGGLKVSSPPSVEVDHRRREVPQRLVRSLVVVEAEAATDSYDGLPLCPRAANACAMASVRHWAPPPDRLDMKIAINPFTIG